MTDEAMEPMAPVDELLEVGERLKRDKARLVELCRQIAGGQDAVCEGVIEASGPKRRGGRRKVNRVNKVNKVPDSSPAEKIRKEYWRKVACPLCGTVTGALRKGEGVGTLYTLKHKDPASGAICKGSDSPAKIATA